MSQEPVVVFEFEFKFDIFVPGHLGRIVREKVNIFNIGKPTVPLDETWPVGKHGPMEKVHTQLARSYRQTVIVQVLSDGHLVVKGFK